MINALFPLSPEESGNYLNVDAWQLYCDFMISNPEIEPEYLDQFEFVEALTDQDEITVEDKDGNVIIKFRY